MVAAVLKALGVFMGDDFGIEGEGSNYEDLEFQGQGVKGLRELIQKRDDKYNIWGWKDPGLIFRIGEVEEDLRNPHFITIFRDPYAIAESECKRNLRPIYEGLKVAMGHLQQLCMFYDRSMSPNAVFSYEKVINNKENFIDEIIDFLKLNITEEVRQKALNSITYGRYTPA